MTTVPALLCRTVLYYWSGDGWVRGTVDRRRRRAVRPRGSGVLARGPEGPSVGAGRRDGRVAARCRLARAGWLLGPGR